MLLIDFIINMFPPNSIKTIKERHHHSHLNSTTLSEPLVPNPNDPLEFNMITKSLLSEMDRDIEKIREWRENEKKDYQSKII